MEFNAIAGAETQHQTLEAEKSELCKALPLEEPEQELECNRITSSEGASSQQPAVIYEASSDREAARLSLHIPKTGKLSQEEARI